MFPGQIDIRLILVSATRIGTIVPRKIVPIVVPFRHGPERGYGDKLASRTPCQRNDARGTGRSGWAKFALSRLD